MYIMRSELKYIYKTLNLVIIKPNKNQTVFDDMYNVIGINLNSRQGIIINQ